MRGCLHLRHVLCTCAACIKNDHIRIMTLPFRYCITQAFRLCTEGVCFVWVMKALWCLPRHDKVYKPYQHDLQRSTMLPRAGPNVKEGLQSAITHFSEVSLQFWFERSIPARLQVLRLHDTCRKFGKLARQNNKVEERAGYES